MALLFFVTLDNLLLKGNVFRKKGPLTGWETADPFAFLTMEIKPDRPLSRVKSGYYGYSGVKVLLTIPKIV